MSIPLLLLAALQSQALPATESRLTLTPVLIQNAMLFSSNRVSTGGAGGGLGLELEWNRRYLVQTDLTVLLSMGNTVAWRTAVGLERQGTWAPAAWATIGVILGDRVEVLAEDGRRPPLPTWAAGVRGSALRFRNESGFVSIAELGVGTDFGGGLWLELTILEAGARF